MKKLMQTLLFCLMMIQLYAQCQEQDYTALRALYLNTDGDNWTDNANWYDAAFFTANPSMPAGTDVGTWYGVTTKGDGCVTQLNLRDNQLSGSIPPEIGNLSNLTYLILRDNQLNGNIPPEIGNLSNLTNLTLNDNQLSGSIPPEIGDLTNLVILYLWSNNLSGNIPPEIGYLNNLIELRLSYNELSGNIPPEIGNLSNLVKLYLRENQLTGNIPPEIGNLSNLTYCILSDNQLSGSIPPELGNLSNLELLRLNNNQLTGSFPPEIGNLTNLIELYLYNNDLSGCYDAALMSLCTQLNETSSMNDKISDGNNFDVPWEEFCMDSMGVCVTSNNEANPVDDSGTYTYSAGEAHYLIYTLKQQGDIDINLYNIHGQELRTIHKASSGAGEYQIEIDKADLPKGIYLIHIHFISNDGTIAYKTLKLLI